VELIISDNHSPDETPDVVAEAMEKYPIRYHRNEENVGAIRNVLVLANELAKGEYCWILGDDDLIRPGGVAKVLETLRARPEVDFVYVSLSHLDLEEYRRCPKPASSFEIKGSLRPDNEFNENRPLERWEHLIDPDISSVFLGAIQSAVVRRSVWAEHADSLVIGDTYSNLDSTYPHIVVYAKGLVGRPAYYIGTPQIIVVDGTRDWVGYVPIIVLVRLNEALDLYQKMGVDGERIERCRKALLFMCGGSLYDLFFDSTSLGREFFSLRSFLRKYGLRRELFKGFAHRVIGSYVKDRNGKPLSGIRLAMARLFPKGSDAADRQFSR
jgi:glycosyltransferase involved in cell wall biosynthesis